MQEPNSHNRKSETFKKDLNPRHSQDQTVIDDMDPPKMRMGHTDSLFVMSKPSSDGVIEGPAETAGSNKTDDGTHVIIDSVEEEKETDAAPRARPTITSVVSIGTTEEGSPDAVCLCQRRHRPRQRRAPKQGAYNKLYTTTFTSANF